jgi:hypothetical protein
LGSSSRRLIQRSQNGTRKLPEIGLFLGKLALFELSWVAAKRSLNESYSSAIFTECLQDSIVCSPDRLWNSDWNQQDVVGVWRVEHHEYIDEQH